LPDEACRAQCRSGEGSARQRVWHLGCGELARERLAGTERMTRSDLVTAGKAEFNDEAFQA
jgi:hypothetical protein